MLKVKLQYFVHLMWRVDSLEKTLMLGGIGGRRRDNRSWDGWMASRTRWMWVWVNSGRWWWTGRPGVLWFMGHKESDTTEQLNWASIPLLTFIHTGNKFFTIINLHSALFSILFDEAKQYLFAFIWEEWIHLDNNASGFFFFFESPYFLQILKAAMDDRTFPRGSISLQYVDDLTASTCFQP